MSETVLAPRANADLRGQDAAEHILLDAWNSGRLPHAWLIAGLRGVGKATLAFRFARFVLAQEVRASAGLFAPAAPPRSLALDAGHPVFKRVASGGHADLMVLEPGMPHPDPPHKETREIVVGHVRRAIEFLSMTPAEGGWRIVIVDQAETMNPNAANALLKILEEPHARSLLILVTQAAGRLLPTLRSRCRRLDVPPLPAGIVVELLISHAPELAPAARASIAALAGGSIGQALDIAAADGLELYKLLLDLIDAREASGEAMHALADRVGGNAATAQAEFRLFLDLAQRLASECARRGAGAKGSAGFSDEEAVIARLAARGPEAWLAAWDRIKRLGSATDGLNLDRRQTALNTIFALRSAGA